MSDSYTTPTRRGLFQGVGAAGVAVFSYVTASRFPFVHHAYWASIAAILSLYPEPHATRVAGTQQLFGAAAGGLIGWATASCWHHHALIYGAGLLLAVSVCYLVHLPDAARLCGLAVTIITLIPFAETPSAIALRRAIEVSYGVTCAIGYTAAVAFIAGLRQRQRSRTA
jgi:uncharacterized membrane protein YgaE (UPF0421/DUF939 family)